MKDKSLEEYVKSLIQKYDYYDPVKDRMESLRFGKIKNMDILDIGAGEGYLAILAAKNFNCTVTTIDISKEKIKMAKINAKKEGVLDKITFKLNNALKIKFNDDSFQAAVSFNALHHNKKNYEKIIKEIFRVSKDKVIVTELNPKGAKVFDNIVHPGGNHKNKIIDLKELENKLSQFGKIKRLDRKLMSTFVCEKK